MIKRILYLFIIVSLSACALGKDYKRPTIEQPDKFRFSEKDAAGVADSAWWEQFGDPNLNKLINTAIKENLDVRIAEARIEQYLGRLSTTRSLLFPQLGATATGARQKSSEKGIVPILPGESPYSTLYQANLSVSNWEIDLWGKLRRATEAAKADMLGQEEFKKGVLLMVINNVSVGYYNLVSLDKQLVIAKETLKTREDNLNIFRERYNAGTVSGVVLSQNESDYYSALATIPQIEDQISQQENNLSILLGKNPGQIERTGVVSNKYVFPPIPKGLPSDLLDRRPDIRKAEEALRAANARIWVAKSQYFPSIQLTGLLGVASTDLTNLFTGPANTWNFLVPITAPIFTAGNIAGQVKTSEAVQKEALATYIKTIQQAFADVENSLVDNQKSREQADVLGKQVVALNNYYTLSMMQYENGYTDYTTVMDAEQQLFNVELTYVQTRFKQRAALINLYTSLGGGWSAAENVKKADKTQVSK